MPLTYTQNEFRDMFWSRVDDSNGPDSCWPWIAGHDGDGYGRITRGRSLLVHRVAYELSIGTIADGLCVCHTCDNRSCCNPKHLFLGSQADNIKDMFQKGRNKKSNNFGDLNGSRTHPEAYPRGETHWHARLTRELVIQMRGLAKQGVSQADIARQLDVNRATANDAILYKSWKHIV